MISTLYQGDNNGYTVQLWAWINVALIRVCRLCNVPYRVLGLFKKKLRSCMGSTKRVLFRATNKLKPLQWTWFNLRPPYFWCSLTMMSVKNHHTLSSFSQVAVVVKAYDRMTSEGDRDLCYHNEKCYRPNTWLDIPTNSGQYWSLK